MTTDATTFDIPELDEHTKHRSLWGDVWEQFRKSKGAMVGITILTILIWASQLGPLFIRLTPPILMLPQQILNRL